MRLDSVHLSMLLIGVSLACSSPSSTSLQEQAYRSAVVIEGKVQSAAGNASAEPQRVNVKVLDVWPLNSGGLEREQLVTVGEFGAEAPCSEVKKNHKYIFFMEPTDEPLVFKAAFAPLDTRGRNLKKDVGRILCGDCGKGMLCGPPAQLPPGRTSGVCFKSVSGGWGGCVTRSQRSVWRLGSVSEGRLCSNFPQLSRAPVAHMIGQTPVLSGSPRTCIRHAPRAVAHQELQLAPPTLQLRTAQQQRRISTAPCTFQRVAFLFSPRTSRWLCPQRTWRRA